VPRVLLDGLALVARALVRFVQVRDGRVTGVRTGGYGYSE